MKTARPPWPGTSPRAVAQRGTVFQVADRELVDGVAAVVGVQPDGAALAVGTNAW